MSFVSLEYKVVLNCVRVMNAFHTGIIIYITFSLFFYQKMSTLANIRILNEYEKNYSSFWKLALLQAPHCFESKKKKKQGCLQPEK